MSQFIDPGRANVLDPVPLARFLSDLSDEALRETETTFRLAADGCAIRLDSDRDFVQFSNDARVIPWIIANIIRSHRKHGTPLLEELEALAASIAEALTESVDAQTEAQWKL
jgi:hypothetical protein